MEKSFDIVFIGHFAIDTIVYDGEVSNSVGGGVTYGSLAAYNYNKSQKLGIFSEIGNDFKDEYLDLFNNTSIDLNGIGHNSEKSTNYKLVYHDGVRDLTLESRAESMEFKNLPESYKSAKCFMLAPIANEISYEFIEELVDKTHNNAYIALDVQGFIRRFKEDGTMNITPDPKKQQLMRDIIELCNGCLILKASDYEANYITGNKDIIQTTQELANEELIEITKNIADENNAIVLSTLGPGGSLIKSKNAKMMHIPAIKPEKPIVDETGAGDCYSAVFLSEFLNSKRSWDEYKKAGYAASAACSFLVEQKGPQGFADAELVQQRLNNMKSIPSELHDKIKFGLF